MKPHILSPIRSCFLFTLILALGVPWSRAGWESRDGVLAWRQGTNLVWQFNYDHHLGKPHFHPLAVNGGPALTSAAPKDHPWHYGLWFSWKYINGVNYWEQDRTTGLAEGKTRWTNPVLQTNADGNASIQMGLEYVNPSGVIVLKESRHLVVSAPAGDGSFTIDWTAKFTAGTEAVEFGRTAMPGEPNGQVNGGYGGFSLRLAPAPLVANLVTESGPVTRFAEYRARPDAGALGCNLTRDGKSVGAIALLSDPGNVADRSPWYCALTPSMRFLCSAVLAPRPLKLAAGKGMSLRYRILVRQAAWTPDDLKARVQEWLDSKSNP